LEQEEQEENPLQTVEHIVVLKDQIQYFRQLHPQVAEVEMDIHLYLEDHHHNQVDLLLEDQELVVRKEQLEEILLQQVPHKGIMVEME
jgi:hypothetical protein